jgi:hypothetical protein
MGLCRPGRIPALIRLLGGYDGDDVLALLATHHQYADGQFSDLMQHPAVGRLRQLTQLTDSFSRHSEDNGEYAENSVSFFI